MEPDNLFRVFSIYSIYILFMNSQYILLDTSQFFKDNFSSADIQNFHYCNWIKLNPVYIQTSTFIMNYNTFQLSITNSILVPTLDYTASSLIDPYSYDNCGSERECSYTYVSNIYFNLFKKYSKLDSAIYFTQIYSDTSTREENRMKLSYGNADNYWNYLCYSYKFSDSAAVNYNITNGPFNMFNIITRVFQTSFDKLKYSPQFYINYDVNTYQVQIPTLFTNIINTSVNAVLLNSMYGSNYNIVNFPKIIRLTDASLPDAQNHFKLYSSFSNITPIPDATLAILATDFKSQSTDNMFLGKLSLSYSSGSLTIQNLDTVNLAIFNYMQNYLLVGQPRDFLPGSYGLDLIFTNVYEDASLITVNLETDLSNPISVILSYDKSTVDANTVDYYKYLYLRFKLTSTGQIIYHEFHLNYFQNFSNKLIYTVGTPTSPSLSYDLNLSFINCFWLKVSTSNEIPSSDPIFVFSYDYTSINSDSMTLSFSLTFITNNSLTMAITMNSMLYIMNPSTKQINLISDWNYICIYQKYKLKKISFTLFVDSANNASTNFSTVQSVTKENFLLDTTLSLTKANGGALSFANFYYQVVTINSDYLSVSNYIFAKYSDSETNNINTLIQSLRYTSSQLDPLNNIYFDGSIFVDLSTAFYQSLTLKDSCSNILSTIAEDNFYTSIFQTGFPKFIFEYGYSINSYTEVQLKFDGEFLFKLIRTYSSNIGITLTVNFNFSAGDPMIFYGTLNPRLGNIISYKNPYNTNLYSIAITIGLPANLIISTSRTITLMFYVKGQITNRASFLNSDPSTDFYSLGNFFIAGYANSDISSIGYYTGTSTKTLFNSLFLKANFMVNSPALSLVNFMTNKTTNSLFINESILVSWYYCSDNNLAALPNSSAITSGDQIQMTFVGGSFLDIFLVTNVSPSLGREANIDPVRFNVTYTSSALTLQSLRFNYDIQTQPLSVYLDDHYLQLTEVVFIRFLTIKINDPSWNLSISKLNINFLKYPYKSTSLDFTTTLQLINTENNYHLYKITFTKNFTTINYSAYIDAYADISLFYFTNMININVLIEHANIVPLYYSSTTNDITTYNIDIILGNSLFPFAFYQSNPSSILLASLVTVSSPTGITSLNATFNKKSILTINYGLIAAPSLFFTFSSSLVIGLIPFQNTFATNPTIIAQSKCANTQLIFIRTNLRYLDLRSTVNNTNTLLSLFEKEIQVYVNPDCFTSCKITFTSNPAISVSANNPCDFLNGANISFIINLQCGQTNYLYPFTYETVQINKSVQNIYSGAMNAALSSSDYLVIPTSANLINIQLIYSLTTPYILKNKITQSTYCKFNITDFTQLGNDYTNLIIVNDCFSASIVTSVALKALQGLTVNFSTDNNISVIKLGNLNIDTNSNLNFTMTVNADSGNFFDSSLYTVTFTLPVITSATYQYHCNFILFHNNINPIIDSNNVIAYTTNQTFIVNSFKFIVPSIKIHNNIDTNFLMKFQCKICDSIWRCGTNTLNNIIVGKPTPAPTPTPTPSPTLAPTPTPSSYPVTAPFPAQLAASTKNSKSAPFIINIIHTNYSDTLSAYIVANNTDQAQKLSNSITMLSNTTDLTQIIQQTIVISQMINNTNCTTYINSVDCKASVQDTQTLVIDKLSQILDCSSVFQSLFGSADPLNSLMLSTLSLYQATSNYKSFTDTSMFKTVDITTCLMAQTPKFFSQLDINSLNNSKNYSKTNMSDTIKSDFLNSLTFSSSNMINVAMHNNLVTGDVSSIGNVTTSANQSLVISTNNLRVKDIIENNAVLLMKYANDYTQHITENIMFVSSSLALSAADPNEASGKRVLISDIRCLQSNVDQINITRDNVDIQIFLPTDYLMNNYASNNITNYGAILYNKYPLLASNNQNFLDNVISLKMFDNEFNCIQATNLSHNISILIKKSNDNFTFCVYFDPMGNSWNNTGCVGTDLGTHMKCTCNHLTDFTLSKINPVAIFEDVVVIFEDIRFVNSFDAFKYITWSNATVIYTFMGILLVYLFGLSFTLRYDKKLEKSAFIMEVEKIYGCCCSSEETIFSIMEIKDITDEAIEVRRKDMVNKFFVKITKHPDDHKKILNIFKIGSLIEEAKKIKKDEDRKSTIKSIFGNNLKKTVVNNEVHLGSGAEQPTHVNDHDDNNNEKSPHKRKDIFKSIFQKKKDTLDKKTVEIELKEIGEINEMDITNKVVSHNKEEQIEIPESDLQINQITIVHDKIKINDNVELKYADFIKSILKNDKKDNFRANLLKSFNINILRSEKTINDAKDTHYGIANNSLDLGISHLEKNYTHNKQYKKNILLDCESLAETHTETHAETEEDKYLELAKEEIEVKNEWWIKAKTIVYEFYKKEYRLIALFIRQDSSMTKTNYWSLMIFRLIGSLSICALISPSNAISGSENVSSSGHVFTNRNLAVSVIAVFFIEIPFTVFEIILLKNQVLKNWTEARKQIEGIKCIVGHYIVYTFFAATYLLGLLNTTWISLRNAESSRSNDFYHDFSMSIVFDYFVYEIVIVTSKSFIYFLIIESDEFACWKKCLVSFIAALPWTFAAFG